MGENCVTDRDIVDEIDALVDWQLDQHERRSGYDYNVNQAKCPHSWCGEDWHSLPIKQRMREIRRLWQSTVSIYEDEPRVPEYVAAELDAYRYDQDDSAIICPGSAFEGEFEPPEPEPVLWDDSSGLPPLLTWPNPFMPWLIEASWPREGLDDPTLILRVERPAWWRRDGVREFEIRPSARAELEIAGSLDRVEGPVQPPTVIVDGVEIATVRDSERGSACILHSAPGSADRWVEVFTRGCPGPGWRRIDPDRPACDGRHVHWAAELPVEPAEAVPGQRLRLVGEVSIAPLGADPTDLSQFRPLGFIDESEAPGFDDGRRFSPRPWVRDRTFDRRGRRR